jgi:Domain of unknown function (DUF4347)
MATTVWAWREGNFKANSLEWTYSVPFGTTSGVEDLLNNLAERNLHGRAERLAIVSHGSQGGVYINGIDLLPVPAQAFLHLGAYVPRGGMLEFVGCDIGASDGGDLFLGALSKLLRDRIIVGYDCKGNFSGYSSKPGQIQPVVSGGTAEKEFLTPWGNHAKWLYNFNIVRKPISVQKDARNKACSNPRCHGHSNETQRCPYVNWGSDPRVKRWSP